MDASQNLTTQLLASLNELLAAFTTPRFYIEMLMIGVSVALAVILAALINGRIRQHVVARPPRNINPEWLLKPLMLVAPLLTILYLGILKPFAERYGDGGFWLNAAVQLCFAFMLAEIVVIVVRSRMVAYFIAGVIVILALLQVTGFLSVTTSYLDSLAFTIGNFQLSMLKLIKGMIILVIVLWLATALTRILENYLRRNSALSFNARELTVKLVKLFIYFTAILVTLSAIGIDLTVFAVFGGALGVGIGLGLQKITANFVSGMTLLMEKSIQIGDMVELGGGADKMLGWVRQMNVRYMLLETFDGREIMIPNDELMSTRVTNWTHTNCRARIEINVGVAYGADARKVLQLLLEAASEHPLCLKDPRPNCYLLEFADSSLNFRLVFWIPDVREGRLRPQSDVMVAILDKFAEAGITIPFPQRDVHIISGQSQNTAFSA